MSPDACDFDADRPAADDSSSDDAASGHAPARSTAEGGVWEVAWAFLRLGLTSFGGPVAHLGYFRADLVERRRWVSDREYADLVTLCQFLPGPASSQVGFALGVRRAGLLGGLAAFVGFTLPSAALMIAFAFGAQWFTGPLGAGLLSGLKIVAVAIVAQAVMGMARSLLVDRRTVGVAVAATGCALLLAGSLGQIVALAMGAVTGMLWCRDAVRTTSTVGGLRLSRRLGAGCLVIFALLFVLGPVVAITTGSAAVSLFDVFYRSGALVFGGGHVVLPLLQAGVVDPGWVDGQQFLAGYGAAQAVPGPLFTFAGYLGAISSFGPGGVVGGVIALSGVFLPGMLLVLGVIPFWDRLRTRAWAAGLMRGASAAVVGILAAALYSPVFITGVTGPTSFVLALVCFALLMTWKTPAWAVVILGAVGGILLQAIG
ncbi:chromate efflux transporter [Pseudoclavibacter sp. CFCC 13611]|uniref:chromate efflux transporter n=1 Tax=Pseudoclavibacter sp. CFCC 13611 TaxID=2615178 RepID=UPI0013014EE0|nr:chromate efflux transporter [Pseudoclavibacter sp. CFCC 13611]KAB1663975.1 chromate efflux transporter [Pseudoclavibacter sp. CFCC 13611]